MQTNPKRTQIGAHEALLCEVGLRIRELKETLKMTGKGGLRQLPMGGIMPVRYLLEWEFWLSSLGKIMEACVS